MSYGMRITTPLLLLLLPACGAIPDEVTRDLAEMKQQIHELRGQLDQVSASLPLLMCGPEMRSLFREIRKECSAGPVADSTTTEGCRTDQLKGAILNAEVLLKRAIGENLTALLRHEVIYLAERSDSIAAERSNRLNELAAEPLSPNTRFLIVASPHKSGAPEALRRAKLITDELVRRLLVHHKDRYTEQELRSRIDLPWIYRLNLSVGQLRPADKPGPMESKDPERAVFVFRTEC